MHHVALLAMALAIRAEVPPAQPVVRRPTVAQIEKENARANELNGKYGQLRRRYQTEFLPRPEMVRELEALLVERPREDLAKMIRREIDLFRDMIAEDEALKKTPPPYPVDTREQMDEYVRWLIHHLRDEVHTNTAVPGLHPGAVLTELGPAAVPQLVASMSDCRLNRANSNTIGGRCRQILSEISGIHGRNEGAWPEIESWWIDIQELGEEATLVKQLRSSALQYNQSLFAQRLAQKFPRTALRELPRVLEMPDVLGEEVIAALDTIDEPAKVVDVLKAQLANRSTLVRVLAARALVARGCHEGETAIFTEWDRLPRQWHDGRAAVILVQQLVELASPASVKALREGLCKRPTLRYTCVCAIAYRQRALTNPRHIEAAFDDVLLDVLQDTTPSFNLNRHRQPMRICDQAAACLAARWEMPEAFEFESSQSIRDCQIRYLLSRRPDESEPPRRLEHLPTPFPPLLAPLRRTVYANHDRILNEFPAEWRPAVNQCIGWLGPPDDLEFLLAHRVRWRGVRAR